MHIILLFLCCYYDLFCLFVASKNSRCFFSPFSSSRISFCATRVLSSFFLTPFLSPLFFSLSLQPLATPLLWRPFLKWALFLSLSYFSFFPSFFISFFLSFFPFFLLPFFKSGGGARAPSAHLLGTCLACKLCKGLKIIRPFTQLSAYSDTSSQHQRRGLDFLCLVSSSSSFFLPFPPPGSAGVYSLLA